MKLTIGEFEVEIKAHTIWSHRNNKNDVMLLLNEISLICDNASRDEARNSGCEALSRRYHKYGDDIYRALKEAGAYYED